MDSKSLTNVTGEKLPLKKLKKTYLLIMPLIFINIQLRAFLSSHNYAPVLHITTHHSKSFLVIILKKIFEVIRQYFLRFETSLSFSVYSKSNYLS